MFWIRKINKSFSFRVNTIEISLIKTSPLAKLILSPAYSSILLLLLTVPSTLFIRAYALAASTFKLNGLVTYSSAPYSKPRSLSSSCDFAVSIMTGTSDFSRKISQTRRPSISGSMISRKTRSIFSFLKIMIASRPVSASKILKPSSVK
ncbi:hypothetical protein SDC9_148877 [bioreactor metagenome]|uniref:Uncharacterized protein n=1 Tax=bioreactor metagenome TaxID=1076179 RepID=A0A645EJP2_9ZZZZ